MITFAVVTCTALIVMLVLVAINDHVVEPWMNRNKR